MASTRDRRGHLRPRRRPARLRAAWVEVKREFTEETGGRWQESAQWDMLGMSSTEWSRYMHDELGVPVPPGADLLGGGRPPRTSGTGSGSRSCPAPSRRSGRWRDEWPLGLASSSNRNVIDLVLRAGRVSPTTSRQRSPPRRSGAASRRPTSTSRRRAGSRSMRPPASRSRTRPTASAPRTPRGWP